MLTGVASLRAQLTEAMCCVAGPPKKTPLTGRAEDHAGKV